MLDPKTSNDTETLGLWGSLHKLTRDQTKEPTALNEAIRGYERGFYLRNDYYNGINYAFLLNERTVIATNLAEAIADFVQARRVRQEVLEICTKSLNEEREVIAVAARANVGLGSAGERLLGSSYNRRSLCWLGGRIVRAAKVRGSFCRRSRRMDEAIHPGAGDQTQNAPNSVSAEETPTRVILMQIFRFSLGSTCQLFIITQ